MWFPKLWFTFLIWFFFVGCSSAEVGNQKEFIENIYSNKCTYIEYVDDNAHTIVYVHKEIWFQKQTFIYAIM